MPFLAIAAESWRALGQNRLRAALTMLGMVIGVASVVLMLAIGQGTQTTVNQAIASMGSNLLVVVPGATTQGGVRLGAGTAGPLTVADAEAIATLPDIAEVAPMHSGALQIVYGPNNWGTNVYGVIPAFWRIRGWDIEAGDGFTEAEVRSAARVAVLGKVVAENLFGTENPVGKTIRIRDLPFVVVGVLAPKGQNLDGRDQDDTVHVPLTTAQRQLFGMSVPGAIRFLIVQARSAEVMEQAQEEIRSLLRQRRRVAQGQEDDFTVRNLSAVAETAAMSARILSLSLGAIASISLVVGGIGIMNIMLVSVTERTREIGIRMAVGARRRDILAQFLLEAVLICTVGGLAGVALGVAIAWMLSETAGMTVVVSLSAIALSFGFAAGIGVFFGFYPAQKAASLQPVEALRHE
jgi:putative ABC transport system permease protein